MKIYNCVKNYNDTEIKELYAEFVNTDMINEIINETSKGYDEEGNLLFFFMKDILPNNKELEPIIDTASTFIISNGRAQASGKLDMTLPLWRKSLKNLVLEDHHKFNKYTLNTAGVKKSNPVYSNIIGYYDKQLIPYKKKIPKIPACRLTQFSNRYFLRYKSLIPYFENISNIMSYCCKDEFKRQNEFIAKHRERIGKSCFSTITINKNFRTACHTDKGDFKNGIGTITTMGEYTGGEFCLIDYKIGFNVKPNDILFVNVHKLHGNLPFEGTRYSMVSYVREHIERCGLKFDYKIVVPSLGRSNEINKRTLKFLEHHNIPKDRIYIFLVKEELEDYSYLKDLNYNLIVGVKGVSEQRSFISNYFLENDCLVWMDDDVDNIYKKIDDKIEPLENFEQFIIDGFTELEDANLNCLGIYPIKNSYFMKERSVIGLKFIIGAFRLTFNKHSYENNINYTCLEDYARTLKYYENDGAVIRNEGYCIAHNYLTLKGGISLNKEERETEKKIEMETLKDEYPKYLSIVEKKKTSDIRFKNLKRFNPKKEIIASFWEGTLTEKEIKCINSWVNMGYKFQLYSYTEIKLEGIEWINADNIVEKSWMDKFPTISCFSDYFRFKLVYNYNVIWVDCDLYCLNPLPQKKFIISSEHMLVKGAFKSKKYYKATTQILKFPIKDLMIESVIDHIDKNIDKIKKMDCFDTLTKHVELFNYYEYVSLPTEFCPIGWMYAKEMYNNTYETCDLKYGVEKPTIDEIKKNSCAIHLWNNITKESILPSFLV